jgi:hypothetical protein
LERGCMVPFDDRSAGVTLLFVSGTYSSFGFSNWVLRLFCWFCDVPYYLVMFQLTVRNLTTVTKPTM